MPNRDGIVSIGFDYKKDLEKMIKDFEAEMNSVSNNTQLSKGMKKQFDNILAEMRDFKSSMDKELANLGSGKVSQSSFKSFKQTVENKFKGIREDIDRLDLAVATLNDSMGILGKGVDLSKISNDFKNFEDYVTRTNSAVENLIHTLGEQGISLFSFDNRNISGVQSTIKKIENELKQLDKDTGTEFELFNEKQAQDELNRLSVQLASTLELMENTKKQMENMDTSTEGFKKVRGEFALLQLKAASLNDAIEMLYEVTESKDMYIEMDDKSLSMYEKYTDELADNLETIISYAKNAKKELSSLLDTQKSPAIKVSSEMNPNSSELATVVTIETTSSELWKKLSPIMEDLQKTLNSNPVVALVKLVVAPTSVLSAETGNLDTSNAYSKKYQKILAQTGEDAVVDLEGVYKKTFTSVMNTAVSYAKETIGKIQEIFDKNLIGVKFEISQEEIDKIQNFVLSNKDGKKVDISGQITKAKQEVEELNENIEKTAKLLDDTKSKGNVKFDGFDKFTQDVSKSIGKLEELQNILKALQNIEITLAKASGITSITELDNQWANVEKRIINATKLDGSFRKNASVSKIASEYQKYIDMGGTNSIADIDKIKDNKDTLDVIISKAKEFAKQDLSNDSVKELSLELDGIIGKFDELISTVKTATNALYKIIKQTGVSELDKQWSSITNKFKSIADESGKINLSKQRKDVEELLVMYQRYVNIGGSHTPFDLTDNLETVTKLDKAYKKLNETKPIDNSSTIKSETESFKQVEQSVDSLTKAIGDTKVQAINIEATAMEDAAEREILAINAIVDSLDVVVKRLKDIKGIKPKIEIKETTSPVETNISSGSNGEIGEDKIQNEINLINQLITLIQKLGGRQSNVFAKIWQETDLLDKELKNVLEKLHIIKNGEIDFSKLGMGASMASALLGDNVGLVMRPIKNSIDDEKISEYYENIKKGLDDSYNSGANVAKILDVIIDKEHGMVYEIQEVARGFHAYSDGADIFFDPAVFEASDEQLKSLLKTILTLNKNKLSLDMIGDNIKYDGEKFSIFDVSLLSNSLEDADVINSFIKSLRKRGGLSDKGNIFIDRIEALSNEVLMESLSYVESQIKETKKLIDFHKDDIINQEDNIREYKNSKDPFELEMLEYSKECLEDSKRSLEIEEQKLIVYEKQRDFLKTNNENISSPIKDTFQSVDTSEIDKATESTKNFTQAQKELNIVFDEKGSKDYWEGRFKEGISDMTKTNEELVRMKSYYEELQKDTVKLDNSSSLLNTLAKYTDATKYTSEFISRVNSVQSEIKNIDVASPEGLARLKEIDLIVDEIISDSKLLENKLIKQDSKIADIISKMKIFRDSNTNMSKSQRADLQALIDSAEVMAKTGDVTAEAIEHIKIGYSGIKAEVTATGNTGLKMIDRIVQRTEDMNAKFIAQFFSWQDWIRYLREGFTIINEIDKSITELRKVSNGTSSDLNHALRSATEDAKELGASISNIVYMQSDWARLGFSIPESEELARTTQLYVNVGDNMSAETASENLISTLQGFQLEAEDSERIIDMFNEVANNFAIDTQGIGEALKRSAASFNSANTSLSESIALVTTANAVVQDPDSIGTTFKTMSARIRGKIVPIYNENYSLCA